MRKLNSKNRGDRIYSFCLLIPAFLLALFFILIPIVDSVIKSFQDFKVKNIISGKPGVWNNFANYIKLFASNALGNAVVNTFVFVVFVADMRYISACFLLINEVAAGVPIVWL